MRWTTTPPPGLQQVERSRFMCRHSERDEAAAEPPPAAVDWQEERPTKFVSSVIYDHVFAPSEIINTVY